MQTYLILLFKMEHFILKCLINIIGYSDRTIRDINKP